MSNTPKFSISDLQSKASDSGRKLRPYSFVIFIVFTVLVYGFVLMRINTLSNLQPTEDAVSSQAKAAPLLSIDPAVINQIQALQDNSVSVQTLFNDARNNPFQ